MAHHVGDATLTSRDLHHPRGRDLRGTDPGPITPNTASRQRFERTAHILTPVGAWLCLRSPERFAFSPSRLRCSRSGAPPARCRRRAAGTLRGVWSGCRRATVSPAARVVRRPSIAPRCPPASVLDAAQSAVTFRSARSVSSSRRARIESAPSAMRSRGAPAGVVDDRTAPAHRHPRSESETSRPSWRLRLGRHRHRRGRSVWPTSRERDGCDASSRSARRHRRWRDTISATLQTSHRTRRAQRGTTPQRTPRDIGPAAPPLFHSLHEVAHAWQPTHVSRSITRPSFFLVVAGSVVMLRPLQ